MKSVVIIAAILSFFSENNLAKENVYIRSYASKMPYQIKLSIATVNDKFIVLDDYTIKYSKDKKINGIEPRTRQIESIVNITSQENIQIGYNKTEYYCKENFMNKNKKNKILEEVVYSEFLKLTNEEKLQLLNQLFVNYSVSEK